MSVHTTNSGPTPITTEILRNDYANKDMDAGVISHLSCDGPCTCTVYGGNGVALLSVDSAEPIDMPVNLVFGGAPVVVQRTADPITITLV